MRGLRAGRGGAPSGLIRVATGLRGSPAVGRLPSGRATATRLSQGVQARRRRRGSGGGGAMWRCAGCTAPPARIGTITAAPTCGKLAQGAGRRVGCTSREARPSACVGPQRCWREPRSKIHGVIEAWKVEQRAREGPTGWEAPARCAQPTTARPPCSPDLRSPAPLRALGTLETPDPGTVGTVQGGRQTQESSDQPVPARHDAPCTTQHSGGQGPVAERPQRDLPNCSSGG